MQDELERICKRMEELARRAEARGCWVYSDFLSLGEQQALQRLRLDAPWQLAGGFEGAERCIVCFGSEALCYDEFDPAGSVSCRGAGQRAFCRAAGTPGCAWRADEPRAGAHRAGRRSGEGDAGVVFLL